MGNCTVIVQVRYAPRHLNHRVRVSSLCDIHLKGATMKWLTLLLHSVELIIIWLSSLIVSI